MGVYIGMVCAHTDHPLKPLAGFKLSAQGVQTQCTRSSNSACVYAPCCVPPTQHLAHAPHVYAYATNHPCLPLSVLPIHATVAHRPCFHPRPHTTRPCPCLPLSVPPAHAPVSHCLCRPSLPPSPTIHATILAHTPHVHAHATHHPYL